MPRRACSSRRCRSSRAIGRRNTTGASVEARLNAFPHFITDDRRPRHSFHSRALEARECAAAHRHARLARLDHRAVEDHRAADRSDGSWRQRRGRVRPGDSVDAGLRLFRQADDDRLGPRAHRARLDRADEAPRLHPLRRAGRRLGRADHRSDGRAGAAGIARHPHEHGRRDAARRSTRRPSPAARRRPVSRADETAGVSTSSPSSTSTAWATPRRWGTARRRCTASRIHRSAWPPGSSTTTSAATSSSRVSSTVSSEGLTRDDILDNITLYWLTKTACLVGASLLGEQAALLRPEGRHHPGGGERLSG